jgi:hypothetical protein
MSGSHAQTSTANQREDIVPIIQNECNGKPVGTKYAFDVITIPNPDIPETASILLALELTQAFADEFGEPVWERTSMEFTFTDVDVHGAMFELPEETNAHSQ